MAKKKPGDVIEVRYVNGFRTAKVPADVAYTELEKIKAKSGGQVTADIVLDAAKGARHPLHKQFEWDDTIAGHEYRKEQARLLVRSIEVFYREAPEVPTRAYHITTHTVSKTTDEITENVYRSTADILGDSEARAELLARALRELVGYQRRFRGLQELTPIFRALNDVLETVDVA